MVCLGLFCSDLRGLGVCLRPVCWSGVMCLCLIYLCLGLWLLVSLIVLVGCSFDFNVWGLGFVLY